MLELAEEDWDKMGMFFGRGMVIIHLLSRYFKLFILIMSIIMATDHKYE